MSLTDQKPTGVFVRLPITDEQAREMYKAYCADYASSSPTTHGTATQAAILAIGTPIQGMELEVVGWNHPQDLADLHIDNSSPDDERFIVMSLVQIGSRDIPLVRQSDAQAQIAARDAEILRLREYYKASEEIYEVGLINASPEMFRRQKRAREDLNGGA